MQPSRRNCFWASLALLVTLPHASQASAETLTITSSPSGATVEIDGLKAGATPYQTDFPGGYFHKTHTAFGTRLEHSMTLRVSMDGYVSEQVMLTEGPFEWVAITGRHRGNYFLLKSTHFEVKLRPVSSSSRDSSDGSRKDGPNRAVSGGAKDLQPSCVAGSCPGLSRHESSRSPDVPVEFLYAQ